MTAVDWADPLVRGTVAPVAAVLLGLLARYRFREKEDDRAPSDMGLD